MMNRGNLQDLVTKMDELFENWRKYLNEAAAKQSENIIREEHRKPLQELTVKDISVDDRGRISGRHRGSKAKDRFDLFGVPFGWNQVITPAYYVALKSSENEYKARHPEEYKEYKKVMVHLSETFKKTKQWRSGKHGYGDADVNKISFPKGFGADKKWNVVKGGFLVGATGGHKKHGREIDWSYGSANNSLPIPLNLQKIFNKNRISSSSKSDAGHQHHLNFYNPNLPNSDKRLARAMKRQYHVKATGDFDIKDIKPVRKIVAVKEFKPGEVEPVEIADVGVEPVEIADVGVEPTEVESWTIPGAPAADAPPPQTTRPGEFVHGFGREDISQDFDFDKFYGELKKRDMFDLLGDQADDYKFGRKHKEAYDALQKITEEEPEEERKHDHDHDQAAEETVAPSNEDMARQFQDDLDYAILAHNTAQEGAVRSDNPSSMGYYQNDMKNAAEIIQKHRKSIEDLGFTPGQVPAAQEPEVVATEDPNAEARRNQLKLQALGVEPVVDVISPVIDPNVTENIIREEYERLFQELYRG